MRRGRELTGTLTTRTFAGTEAVPICDALTIGRVVVVTDDAARSDQYVSSDLISFARDDRRRPPMKP